jgi:hypothetical protein
MEESNDEWICQHEGCKRYFEAPVILPCFNSICKQHVIDGNCGNSLFKCTLCNDLHIIPDTGFKSNTAILKVINSNLHLKDEHKRAKLMFNQVELLLNDNQSLENQETFLVEFFSNIEKQIEMHRDKLIVKVKDLHKESLQKIRLFKEECVENMVNVTKIDSELLRSNIILKWKETLRTPDLESGQIKVLLEEMDFSHLNLQKQSQSYKQDLLMNKACEFNIADDDFINFGLVVNKENEIQTNEPTSENSKPLDFSHSLMIYKGLCRRFIQEFENIFNKTYKIILTVARVKQVTSNP